MMMKEHIVDNYGEVKYTLGNGCSGGSIQQNTVSVDLPGLLDGIQPSCDYPGLDQPPGWKSSTACCFVNTYVTPQWTALMGGLTQAQINAKKTAINGHLDHTGCHSWNNAFGFNNKPGNYVPTVVANSAGTHRAERRAAQQLPPAGLAGLRPGVEPERHALRRPRPSTVRVGLDGRRGRRHPCDADRRQRRHPVRPEGAAGGRDHGEKSS
jgi:hypothetical protein